MQVLSNNGTRKIKLTQTEQRQITACGATCLELAALDTDLAITDAAAKAVAALAVIGAKYVEKAEAK